MIRLQRHLYSSKNERIMNVYTPTSYKHDAIIVVFIQFL